MVDGDCRNPAGVSRETFAQRFGECTRYRLDCGDTNGLGSDVVSTPSKPEPRRPLALATGRHHAATSPHWASGFPLAIAADGEFKVRLVAAETE